MRFLDDFAKELAYPLLMFLLRYRHLLRKRERAGSTHPLMSATEAVIADSLPELLREIVKDSIQELLDDYFLRKNFESKCNHRTSLCGIQLLSSF